MWDGEFPTRANLEESKACYTVYVGVGELGCFRIHQWAPLGSANQYISVTYTWALRLPAHSRD